MKGTLSLTLVLVPAVVRCPVGTSEERPPPTTEAPDVGEETDPGPTTTGPTCPDAPSVGCDHSDLPCATDLLHEYPCGEPTVSGADVDLYVDVDPTTGDRNAWLTTTLDTDACEPYLALVAHTFVDGEHDHRFRYTPVGGGCAGFWLRHDNQYATILDIVREEPCTTTTPPALGSIDSSTGASERDPTDLGAGVFGIYRKPGDVPLDPGYYFIRNGTGCWFELDVWQWASSHPDIGPSVWQGVQIPPGDHYALGPGQVPNAGEVLTLAYRAENLRMMPSCLLTDCPDGMRCTGDAWCVDE